MLSSESKLLYLCIIFSNMTKIIFSITVVCFLFLGAQTHAQYHFQDDKTFGEIKAIVDSIYEAMDDKFEKGSGFKQYERWKYFWEQRIKDDQQIPSASYVHNKRMEAIRQSGQYNALEGPHTSNKTTSGDAWEPMGASHAAGGYEGLGRLVCIGFHPTDKNIFYVGAPAGGMWRTMDFGATWTPLTDFLPQIGIASILIHPNDPNTIYIATGDPDGADNNSIGVLKSTDAGATWDTTGLSFDIDTRSQIYRMVMNPQNPDMLVAATSQGIYVTHDGAMNWDQKIAGSYRDLLFHPTDTSILYAIRRVSVFNEFYKSLDGGDTWNDSYTFSSAKRVNIAVSVDAPNTVQCVAVNSDNALQSMYVSMDTGNTFSAYADPQITGLNLLAYDPTGSNLTSGQGWYDLFISIDPQDDLHLTVGGINVWDSYNGGQTWTISTHWYGAQGIPEVHADQHSCAYHPLDPDIQFLLNDGGIYYRNLDSSYTDFIEISDGLSINQIYKLAVGDSNDLILTGLQDNGSKLRENGSWRRATGGDGGECAIDKIDNDYMYAEYVYGVVYRSNDKFDNNRVTISNNLPLSAGSGAWITPFELYENSPNELLIGYADLYYSADRGNTFSTITSMPSYDPLRSIATSTANRNVCYVTDRDHITFTYDMFGSSTWTVITSNSLSLPLSDLYCNMVEVSPIDAGRAIAVFSGFEANKKVYLTIDSGQTWTNISTGLPDLPALCVAMDNSANNGIYVGMDVGVYYKDDLLSSFIPFGDSLPHAPVTKIVLGEKENSIYVSTYGRGVWKNTQYGSSSQLALSASGPMCDSSENVYIASGLSSATAVYYWEVNSIPFGTNQTDQLITDQLVSGDKLSCLAVDGTDTFRSNILVYSPLPNPTPHIFLNSSGTVIVSQYFTGNQWLKDGEPIPGANSKLYNKGSDFGAYSLITLHENGCLSDTSNVLYIYPDAVDHLGEVQVTVHPTLASDMVMVSSDVSLLGVQYRVIDARGSVVLNGNLMDKANQLDISVLVAGTYIIELPNIARRFKFQKK